MNHRSHNNADKRVYRIVHTHGELKGKSSEIHGRAFYEGLEKGALVLVDESRKLARVASGWLAHVVSKTEVAYLRFVKMVSNWGIIEKVYIFRGKKLKKIDQEHLMRNSEPLIPAQDFPVGESRMRIGSKKEKRYIRRIEYATTEPVY